MKKVTIQDIAEALNISFSTVARALNDHPAISPATKKRVREAARKMHYRPNKLASSLRSGKTHVVGVIVPNLHVSFFSSVVHGIDTVLNEHQYSLLLYQSNESLGQEVKGIDTFLRSRVDGIIASITRETSHYEHYDEIRKRHVPLILFDRVAESLRVPSVRIDDYKGGFMATEHLIAQGYTNIAHITAEQDLAIATERLRGYRDALIRHGLPVQEELICKGPFSADFGRACVASLLDRKVPFDALFALEDFTALGALQELLERGVRVPDEVGVIGFANESFGTLVTPGLSSVDQQTVRMGEIAAELFLGTVSGNTPASVMLDPILVPRASSLRIR
ncbi:LacI family DNA-binding transcriptional regulator [Dinghuibacter silviterrae]|uniref:LacI family DNA-binding transcriptional regulator n=1 Tax=Dinghuibacter silviterrae TaxID=1539049 RepID=UPI0010634F86|nr:LacI family DNA-binding transcriptional regulator [Dinghuibacter silviterrae]